MLLKNPDQRWTASQCLRSPWLRQVARRRYDPTFDAEVRVQEAARLAGLGMVGLEDEEVEVAAPEWEDCASVAAATVVLPLQERKEPCGCGGEGAVLPVVEGVEAAVQRDGDEAVGGAAAAAPAKLLPLGRPHQRTQGQSSQPRRRVTATWVKRGGDHLSRAHHPHLRGSGWRMGAMQHYQ